jgi:hypothetical protein
MMPLEMLLAIAWLRFLRVRLVGDLIEVEVHGSLADAEDGGDLRRSCPRWPRTGTPSPDPTARPGISSGPAWP